MAMAPGRRQEMWLKATGPAGMLDLLQRNSSEQDTDIPDPDGTTLQDISDVMTMSGASPHADAWRAQMEALETRLHRLDGEKAALQRQLDEERSLRMAMDRRPSVGSLRGPSSLGSMCRAQSFRLDNSDSERCEEEQPSELDVEKETLLAELAEHRGRMAAFQAEAQRLSQQRDSLAEESRRLQQDCQVQRQEASQREERCAELQKAISELKSGNPPDSEALQAAITDLEMQRSEGEGLRATARRLEVELAQERARGREQWAELEQLRERAVALAAENQELSESLAQQAAQSRRLEGERAETGAVSMLQEEYAALVAKVDALRQEAEFLRAERAELGASRREALETEELKRQRGKLLHQQQHMEEELRQQRLLSEQQVAELSRLEEETGRLTELCAALAAEAHKASVPKEAEGPLTKEEAERLIVDHAALAQERWQLAAEAEAQRQRAETFSSELGSLRAEMAVRAASSAAAASVAAAQAQAQAQAQQVVSLSSPPAASPAASTLASAVAAPLPPGVAAVVAAQLAKTVPLATPAVELVAQPVPTRQGSAVPAPHAHLPQRCDSRATLHRAASLDDTAKTLSASIATRPEAVASLDASPLLASRSLPVHGSVERRRQAWPAAVAVAPVATGTPQRMPTGLASCGGVSSGVGSVPMPRLLPRACSGMEPRAIEPRANGSACVPEAPRVAPNPAPQQRSSPPGTARQQRSALLSAARPQAARQSLGEDSLRRLDPKRVSRGNSAVGGSPGGGCCQSLPAQGGGGASRAPAVLVALRASSATQAPLRH